MGVQVWQLDDLFQNLKKRSSSATGLTRIVTGEHWTALPNKSTDQIGKNCPKIVFAVPRDNFWTFFRHFFDIFRTFCRHSLFLGCETICLLQDKHIFCLKALQFPNHKWCSSSASAKYRHPQKHYIHKWFSEIFLLSGFNYNYINNC